MDSLNNAKLKEVYDRGYGNDVPQSSFPPNEERKTILDFMASWEGLEVLELGCGAGKLANLIALLGAKSVYAIDYSEPAIQEAEKIKADNVIFDIGDLHDVEGLYDVIVMQGVLEHLDKPYDDLTDIVNRNLKLNGIIITSSPNFLNPRGYVWMTIYYMIRIHMAAVDLNFIYPWDMAKWADNNGYNLEYKSCDQSWGCGEKMLIDFHKRLRGPLFNEHLRSMPDIEGFLDWLKKAGDHFTQTELTGANIVYKLNRL